MADAALSVKSWRPAWDMVVMSWAEYEYNAKE